MIYGLGTDIMDVERLKKQLLKEDGLREKIFTEGEINYCESKRYKYRHYAVRYAAKEAFFKALGTGWRHGMKYQEIEINNDPLGKPDVILQGTAKEYFNVNALSGIYVSLSHLKNIVNAVVIIEK